MAASLQPPSHGGVCQESLHSSKPGAELDTTPCPQLEAVTGAEKEGKILISLD